MAGKKIAKVVTANEAVGAMVDRGADVNLQLKNVQFEDVAIKGELTRAAEKEVSEGEVVNVKLVGKRSAALVVMTETFVVDATLTPFKKVQEAMDKGMLAQVVKVTSEMKIPQDKIADVVRILTAAGIPAMVQTNVAVDPDAYRELQGMTSSPELSEIKEALGFCVLRKFTTRISYSTVETVKPTE